MSRRKNQQDYQIIKYFDIVLDSDLVEIEIADEREIEDVIIIIITNLII